MSFHRRITTLLFVLFLGLQCACKGEEQGAAGAAATSGSAAATALVTLPSSAVIVAENNQVVSYNPDGNQGWSFALPNNDTVAARPVAALSSTTYVRGAEGLYAIAANGKTMWQAKHAGANDTVKGLTALGDSTVALTVGDNSLVGYNAQGQPKWTFKLPDEDKITALPALAASSIVYLRSAKKVYAVDSQGNLAWAAVIGESAKK